jgi:hypothetical protein
MRVVQIKLIWGVLCAKTYKPLKTVPMGIDASIPLMNLLHEECPGPLLEPLHHRCLDSSIGLLPPGIPMCLAQKFGTALY